MENSIYGGFYKMMHREVVATRKVPVIAILLLLTTIVLYVYKFIELIGLREKFIGGILSTTILIFSFIIALKELRSCSLSYKYQIIGDKLIVNKIKSKNEENLESVNICNIIYVGRKCEIPKVYSNVKNKKSYLCNIIGEETYYCLYKKDGKVSKFAFQPSDKFIKRIIKHSCNCNINNEKWFT